MGNKRTTKETTTRDIIYDEAGRVVKEVVTKTTTESRN